MSNSWDVRVKVAKTTDSLRIIAETKEEALLRVPQNFRVLSIQRGRKRLIKKVLSRSDRITLLRRLAMMTRSNVGLSTALKKIAASFTGTLKEVAERIEDRVAAGENFDVVLDGMPEHFPPATVSLIKSGMEGGQIGVALLDAANFENEMEKIGKQARGGLLSAAFEFLIAAVLIIVTAYWVGPWVMDSKMMKMSGGEVNIDWAFLLADILAALTVLIIVASVSLLMIAYVLKPFMPYFADRLVLKIPVFRDLVLSKTYYSVFYGAALLLSSGVMLKKSIGLARDSAPSGAVRNDLTNAYEAIETGQDWASQMVNLHPTERACLETAQDRSEISEAFLAVAQTHREVYAQRIGQVVPTLSVVSNIFMFMAGFLVFAMMMLPNLQLTKGILS